MKKYKHCQSCGMPFSMDKEAYYEDKKYCSLCYDVKTNKFHSPDMSREEMKKLVFQKLLEHKIPKLMAKFLMRSFNKYERWQKEDPRIP